MLLNMQTTTKVLLKVKFSCCIDSLGSRGEIADIQPVQTHCVVFYVFSGFLWCILLCSPTPALHPPVIPLTFVSPLLFTCISSHQRASYFSVSAKPMSLCLILLKVRQRRRPLSTPVELRWRSTVIDSFGITITHHPG